MKQAEKMILAIRDWVKSNIEKTNEHIEINFLQKTGDASKVTSVFSNASSRTLPASGENLDITIGKIRKYLNDLGSMAYRTSVDYRTSVINFKAVQVVTRGFSGGSDAADIDISFGKWYSSSQQESRKNVYLLYAAGGPISAGKIDFFRVYIIYRESDWSHGFAGEAWKFCQLGSVGSTARWTVKTFSATNDYSGLTIHRNANCHCEYVVLKLPMSQDYVV